MRLRRFIEPSFVRSIVAAVIIILIVLPSEALFAQDQANTLSKYWAYRQRLRDKFIYISDHVESAGHNIPASDRNIGVELSWGDADNMWNHYLGMLATELWLLKNNGQDYHETLTELYYAMLTIGRLDLYSEAVYRGSFDYGSDRNGLHNRDDVTWDFWLSHHDHFGISGLASSVAGIKTSFTGSSIPSYLKQTMVVNARSDLHDGSYFELLSVDGQLLHRQNITASKHNVDISHLANGTYIVKFYTNNELTVQKIVVMN